MVYDRAACSVVTSGGEPPHSQMVLADGQSWLLGAMRLGFASDFLACRWRGWTCYAREIAHVLDSRDSLQ